MPRVRRADLSKNDRATSPVTGTQTTRHANGAARSSRLVVRGGRAIITGRIGPEVTQARAPWAAGGPVIRGRPRLSLTEPRPLPHRSLTAERTGGGRSRSGASWTRGRFSSSPRGHGRPEPGVPRPATGHTPAIHGKGGLGPNWKRSRHLELPASSGATHDDGDDGGDDSRMPPPLPATAEWHGVPDCWDGEANQGRARTGRFGRDTVRKDATGRPASPRQADRPAARTKIGMPGRRGGDPRLDEDGEMGPESGGPRPAVVPSSLVPCPSHLSACCGAGLPCVPSSSVVRRGLWALLARLAALGARTPGPEAAACARRSDVDWSSDEPAATAAPRPDSCWRAASVIPGRRFCQRRRPAAETGPVRWSAPALISCRGNNLQRLNGHWPTPRTDVADLGVGGGRGRRPKRGHVSVSAPSSSLLRRDRLPCVARRKHLLVRGRRLPAPFVPLASPGHRPCRGAFGPKQPLGLLVSPSCASCMVHRPHRVVSRRTGRTLERKAAVGSPRSRKWRAARTACRRAGRSRCLPRIFHCYIPTYIGPPSARFRRCA